MNTQEEQQFLQNSASASRAAEATARSSGVNTLHNAATARSSGETARNTGETAKNTGETAKNTRDMVKQQTITNVQLLALNATNLAMLATQKRLETVQKEQLEAANQHIDQTKRTNLLLELQGEERQMEKLEKERQRQLKQGAFSLSKEVEQILQYRMVSRLILLNQKKSEVAEVNLTPDELSEIPDKEYTHGVLDKLHSSIARTGTDIDAGDRQRASEFITALADSGRLFGELSQKDQEEERIQAEHLSLAKRKEEFAKQAEDLTPVKMLWLQGLIAIGLTSLFYFGRWVWGSIGVLWLLAIWASRQDKTALAKLQKQVAELDTELKALQDTLRRTGDAKVALRDRLDKARATVKSGIAEFPELSVFSNN